MTQYVALKAFKLGERTLSPGESVPLEPGRDFRALARRGFITALPDAAPSEPDGALVIVVRPGQAVVFVAEDSEAHAGVLLEQVEVPEEAREGLGLDEGALVALVDFGDPEGAVLVRPDRLLPALALGPVTRLRARLADAEREAREAGARLQVQIETAERERFETQRETAEREHREVVARLEAQLADLQRESGDRSAPGANPEAERAEPPASDAPEPAAPPEPEPTPPPPTPLPAKFPGLRSLTAAGLTTYEDLAGRTRDQLAAIDGITPEKADAILARLATRE